MTRRIAAEVTLEGRTYSLIVDADGGRIEVGWYCGHVFVGKPTALEQAIGLLLEAKRKELVKTKCDKDKSRDCFDCPNEDCEFFWGDLFSTPFVVRDPEPLEEQVMPSKKDLKKAAAKGVNPYAVAQAMVNKGKISPAKKERAVKSITQSAIKSKGRTKK